MTLGEILSFVLKMPLKSKNKTGKKMKADKEAYLLPMARPQKIALVVSLSKSPVNNGSIRLMMAKAMTAPTEKSM
ncbi:MAG: hypothetical protein A2606_02320 [Candidatus Yanofskybacteria bacterium RIFOXYD1_FULL_42_10]|uniref:Uncharacterized protein n=1 Tax=Candidatus Yanofskybacteria bacterium RIFOXYD1_FULL_42_10 TaxID=1802718 RepID=A0A1F8HV17_9BACT|nr:MAG: hypothetical protein A2606_02320 [Candidatus Yanofskybacteria bacterium RIFOXYD1_FULL_42_10]